ncbi:serine/threonine-protein kinase [Novipirellula artificiosorum]|uniref:Serine/threonine-protein kinase PknF n=1 Tax=Novipirellula artificiosorum TaxID=2528016 RepID=A0A5C6E4U3_9BACT|nr:protein kinase [Novipirellula artificiosorum]TWU42446.1 Serine/threonine-protein kinase PknF [Novipirellula artificiosorum]
MSTTAKPGDEIVPGFTLVRRLGSGMAGEVWIARASGGVQVAVKIIQDLELLGSQRELGALRVVREVKHPNLCPLFGVWFFDARGNRLDATQTEAAFYHDSQMVDTMVLDATRESETEADDQSIVSTQPIGASAPVPKPSSESTNFKQQFSQPVPVRMVVAMGLGEKTLFDRLREVQASRLTSEKLDPKDLEEMGGIEVKELLRYLGSAASAIDELNKRFNIYHCDIKPQNILVVGGQAQVCDFGLARHVAKSRQTQMAFATPAYGAPEMLFERTYSKTIDQYSLAITYYELRTGKLPFDRDTQSALLKAKASGDLDLSLVPAEERKVIARATRLAPDKRYEDCQSFVAALNQAVDRPAVTHPAWTAPRVSALAFVVLAAMAVAAWYLLPTSAPDRIANRDVASVAVIDDVPTAEPSAQATSEAPVVTRNPTPEVVNESTNDIEGEKELSELKSQPSDVDGQPSNVEMEASEVEASEVDPSEVDPSEVDPSEVDPSEVDPSEVDPSEVEPREVEQSEMAVLPTDLPSLLRAAGISAESPSQRMASQYDLLQNASFSEQQQLAPELLDALITDVCEAMLAQFQAVENPSRIDSDVLEDADRMCECLLRILQQPLASDRTPQLARLMLARLHGDIAAVDHTESIWVHADEVRLGFNPKGQYTHPSSSCDASFAVAYSGMMRREVATWDRQLVETDLQRCVTLCKKDSGYQSALVSLHGQYLIALLLQRPQYRDDPSLSKATLRAAHFLVGDSTWSALASMAFWLIDPLAERDDVCLLSEERPLMPASLPAVVPPKLETQYRMAAGWADWNQNESRSAFDAWQRVASDVDLVSNTAAEDRQQAARYLLDWLINSSGTSDTQIDSIRYARLHRSAGRVLDAVDRLAVGSDTLQQSLASERILCSVAAGDFDTAEVALSEYRRTVTQRLELAFTPQLGRAVFEVGSNHINLRDSHADADAEWTSLACAACIAQTTVDLMQQKEASRVTRDALLDRCYRPLMQNLKPRLRASPVAEPTVPEEVDHQLFVDFCEHFISLAAQPEQRSLYGNLLEWLDQVEVAAAIAGAAATDREVHADLICMACEAFMQSRYEQQDDMDRDKIIDRMEQYYRDATALGKTIRTDFLRARITDQQGFASSDADQSRALYQEATELYDQVILAESKADDSLRGIALRCRASVQLRHANQLNPLQRDALLLKALEDARESLGFNKCWYDDDDDRLETQADVCWQIASLSKSLTDSERNQLLDEANGAIDQAIRNRRRDSISYTPLALKKLNGLWIDMLLNPGTPRMRQTQATTLQWMSEISDRIEAEQQGRLATLTIQADSVRLQCLWHSRAARIYAIIDDKKTALRHSEAGFRAATKSLSAKDSIRHIISLEYVILKSETLGAGDRDSNQNLHRELRNVLLKIQDPRPEIRERQEFYLKALERF